MGLDGLGADGGVGGFLAEFGDVGLEVVVDEFADPINGVSTPDQVFSLYKLFKTECKINIMDLFFRVNIWQQQYDEKNIRRRVYDALNVLMAMDIISKDKKEIQWKGLPRTSLSDIEELKVCKQY